MEIKIQELKKTIENKTVSDSFLVLLYSDNTFLANQYLDEIVNIKGKQKVYIDKLEDITINNFGFSDNNLYVINTETFNSEVKNFYNYKNIIVICKNISEKTRPRVVETGYHTKMPELNKSQILQYMIAKIPSVPENDIKWLYRVLNGDIFKINNELLKLSMFDGKTQFELFRELIKEGVYKDTGITDRFSLKDSILKRDINNLSKIMSSLNEIEIEPLYLISLLNDSIKTIIKVNLDKTSTPKSSETTEGQYKFIHENYNYLNKYLVKMFEFTTSIDFKLKSGLLQMTDERLIDYIIVNILQLMNA
jgi:DNA polymerase III delta subunit